MQTDKVIETRKPDLKLINKEINQCQVIDIAIPGDIRVVQKEDEKIGKYKELVFEINRLCNVKTSDTNSNWCNRNNINEAYSILGRGRS